jgi:hypothetical protein
MPASTAGQSTQNTTQTAHNPLAGYETIDVGATFTSPMLPADGLPQCNAYFLQDAAGVVQARAQFLQTPGVWLNFEPDFGPVLNVPLLKHYTLGAPAYRLQIQNTGLAPVTVYWRLTATVPGT